MLPTEWRYKRNVEPNNSRLRGTTHYNLAWPQIDYVFNLNFTLKSQAPLRVGG